MKMKLLGLITVAVLVAGMVQAADYDKGQMSNVRVYRVALGSGTAPSAADMAYNGVHNGDFVLNMSDNALYIMNASNVYVKITAAGAMTIAGAINGVVLDTHTVTNVLAAGSVLPAVDLSAGTNITPANIASGTLPALNGSALTALASANLAGNIAQARITNALATAGSVIGGNIPIADLTNALNVIAGAYTNAQATFTNVFSATGVLISHTP